MGREGNVPQFQTPGSITVSRTFSSLVLRHETPNCKTVSQITYTVLLETLNTAQSNATPQLFVPSSIAYPRGYISKIVEKSVRVTSY